MAKINKEQIEKINARCSNDWKVDIMQLASFGQKQLIKNIPIDDESFLEFTLGYNSDKQVYLHISKFEYVRKGDNLATSDGIGKYKILDETQQQRRNIDKLIDFSNILTNEKLLEINSNTKVEKGNGIIFASEDF